MFKDAEKISRESAGPRRAGGPGVPVVEILTIGDELCRGEIVDTNSAWLAERLTDLGFHVRFRSSVTDEPGDMADALRLAASRADVIVTSGGLGPTEDDRTVDVVSDLVGRAPVADPAHEARMSARFAERGFAVTSNNLRQVRVPAGTEVLANSTGFAPGFHVRLPRGGAAGDALLFVTPGVPREMKAMFDAEIAPRLAARLESLGARALRTARRAIRVAAMGESHVDHRLRGLLDGVPDATLHFRLAFPEILVTVVARRGSDEEARAVIGALDAEVRARLGSHAYGIDDDTLAKAIGDRLRARGETLATAESCTGGLVSDQITDVPGSSSYFRGALVAYDNSLKTGLLGVREETLAAHGAVSEACVREMAEGARRLLGATWAVALSGVAGPGGGTVDKPVGLVHFAVAGPAEHGGTEARSITWPNERRLVKQMAAAQALFMLLRRLEALPAPDGDGR